jgi:hypothetical protein
VSRQELCPLVRDERATYPAALMIRSRIRDHGDYEMGDGERTGSTPLSMANRTQLAPKAKACLMVLYWLGSSVGANRVSVVLYEEQEEY